MVLFWFFLVKLLNLVCPKFGRVHKKLIGSKALVLSQVNSMPQTVSRSQPNGKNKQAQASAVLFSICNKPPERQATASCLARREWNRLYTWENTAQWVAFLIGSQTRCSSHQWGPTCRYCGPVCVWGTGKEGERSTAQRRSGKRSASFACQ